MGGEYADMELASFMSTSKGFMGEYVLHCSVINSIDKYGYEWDVVIGMWAYFTIWNKSTPLIR